MSTRIAAANARGSEIRPDASASSAGSSSGGLRILMVAPQPFFEPRGTPFSVLHRIRALLRLGHTVDLVTYPFGDSPELPGLVVHRTARPPGMHHVAVGPSLAKAVLDVPLFLQTYRLARTRQFDLLHTHEEAGFVGAWIARRFGLPHLYDMHSSLPQQLANFDRFNWRPMVALFNLLERRALAGSDALIAICPDLRDHVLSLGYGGPLAMIENSLDFDAPAISPSEVASLRRRLGLERARLVVYTGTLEQYQGLELLIDAAPETHQRVPEARFLLVGGVEEQIARLRKLAQARGVESLFTFVPAVPPMEVFLYLRAADVLVTCRTRGTNTPLKVYQYLRAGKPIVATRIYSHTQALDEQSAELVPPTAGGIAAGLIRVLTEPRLASAYAEGALRVSRERYSEEAYMTQLRELLAQLPVRPRQRSAP